MAIRIGIDSRSLRTGPSGVATVVQNLLTHIPELVPFDPRYPKNNFLWNQLRVPPAARWNRWSLFHAPSYTGPLLMPCPTVLSVHDVSYLASGNYYPYKLDRLRRYFYISSIRRADRVLVPSDFSKQELACRFSERESQIRKVPLAVSSDFSTDPQLGDQARKRFGLPEKFLLHVGDIHPRRNIPLIQAVSVDLGWPLVLVGRTFQKVDLKTDRVLLLRGISQRDLIGIYNAASVLVYPSVYEGFGLPLLEAMACGLPVVAANRASIPEVCGDAAFLVEPEKESILEGIKGVLDSREEYEARGLKRAKQFSWEKTARKTFRVYEELL